MTAKERRQVYERALKLIKKKYGYLPTYGVGTGEIFECHCLCGAMCTVTTSPFRIEEFPELLECKPPNKQKDVFWWPTNEKGFLIRIMALDYAIERTHQYEALEKSVAKLER